MSAIESASISRSIPWRALMTQIPRPSDAVLIRLAGIAAHAEKVLVPEQPLGKAQVGLNTIKNDRRRAMETALVLLADSEVRAYLADLERLGLLK